jgi:hypothetical protein
MITENQQKWLDALRSGKYKQGFHYLRDLNDCYCPYGVLVDISNLGKWELNGLTFYSYKINEEGDKIRCCIPNDLVIEWANLSKYYQNAMSPNFRVMDWNDSEEFNFLQIADKIEAVLRNE